MLPLDYYRHQCELGIVHSDEQQLAVLAHLQSIYTALLDEHKARRSLFAWLRKPRLVHGLYLWGGVGVGKTLLMDCFYQSIPFTQKMRIHFHEFMRWLHSELTKHQGEKNPVAMVAKQLAQQTMLICFDEIVVKDITDAMLLTRFFQAMFAEGICLVATSNIKPDDLYKNGLQRKLFLPAIELLKKHTHVVHITTTTDYRLRHLQYAGVFFTPNDAIAEENMEKSFALLVQDTPGSFDPIRLCDRTVAIRKQAGDVIWFDFDVLCRIPRSQHDYLALAKQYRTVFISNIPRMSAKNNNEISLFIRLIDVLYDARVRLVFSAADTIDQLYQEGRLLFDYQRTCSRLIEMQSEAYFTAKN